jgi:hypothetical protein
VIYEEHVRLACPRPSQHANLLVPHPDADAQRPTHRLQRQSRLSDSAVERDKRQDPHTSHALMGG